MALRQCLEQPIFVWLPCLSLQCSAAFQHPCPTPQLSLPLTSSAVAQKCPADPKPGWTPSRATEQSGMWRGTTEVQDASLA